MSSLIGFDTKTPVNQRARLDTGTFCNYDCEFCYYKEQLDIRDSLEIIKKRVDYIKNYGIMEVDLSGGESSVEPHWFDILEYCKGMNISCVSHGGKFHDMTFLRKSVSMGLSEILFSLHGGDAETHDKITKRKGSFDRLIKAISNCNDIGIKVRINCTVYDYNKDNLPTKYINILKPSQVNYIIMNYSLDNKDFREQELEPLTDAIKESIDSITIKDINVRYVPFCYMKGYEKYVVGYYQHIFDLTDWNIQLFPENLDTSIEYTDEEKLRHAYDQAENNRRVEYTKMDDCKDCKNYFICDGVKTRMKVYPIKGKKVIWPNHYRY
jgi:MoaA/NifB/PqqE/SkfB family radical SAM enzyme